MPPFRFAMLAAVGGGGLCLSGCGSSPRPAAAVATDAGEVEAGTGSDVDGGGGSDTGADTGAEASGDAAPLRSCSIAPPAPSDWRLRADSTALRDALGRTVFLRGVNAGARSKFAPYVPFDFTTGQFAAALDAYMDRAASWGIDAMRVPFTWAALEPAQGTRSADWLSQYQQIIDAAWARGIWAVVDFHQDVYSECFCGDGFPSWTVASPPAAHHDCPGWSSEYFSDPAVQQAFDAFWASGSTVMPEYLAAWDAMIARFKDEPGVVGFEPINEPAPGTQALAAFESTTLSAFYGQVIPHLRQAAPQSLVFVGLPPLDGPTSSTSLPRPAGDGFVLAPHFYPLSKAPADVQAGLGKWATLGAAWNVPVFVGEFGEPHGATGVLDYVATCFGAFDALAMSGVEWEYSVSSEEWNSESYEVVAADGTEYPVVQALVRPFARAVAGGSITQSWDPSSRTYALSYAPSGSGGVTEIQLPARAYPQGWSVTVEGGCYDAISVPGRMLVRADGGAARVRLALGPP